LLLSAEKNGEESSCVNFANQSVIAAKHVDFFTWIHTGICRTKNIYINVSKLR
jgi:hypothetical protein